MAAAVVAAVLGAPRVAALGLVALYKVLISPLLPPACRYYPTCSDYAAGCLRHHGFIRGGWLAAKRLGRCHPWHEGGYDPVPGHAGHVEELS